MTAAGRVEYYYCEVDTWHTTHANGIEVFYFPNGQTEAHHPSGTKEIIFPDGVIRRVFTDGREQDVTPEQLSGPVKYPMPEDRDLHATESSGTHGPAHCRVIWLERSKLVQL